MSDFQLNILGCGSATPSPKRNPSSQVIDYRRRLMMIDCGEGAQATMRRMGLSFSRLTHIFISHMHGDHCLGLPGLLSTLALHGKEGSVTVVLPESGVRIMKEITDYFCREPQLEIIFQPVSGEGGIVLELPSLTVEAFPLYHRIESYGYLFREKPKQRHLKGDMVEFYNVPVAMRPLLKDGADFVTDDGRTIENRLLTRDPDPSRSYAYCSDTMFDERVAHAVSGVDLLYHEATYDKSLAAEARKRGHSTALEAGKIASLAKAGKLIIGHYSKRYNDIEPLVSEAASVFPNVIAASDGLKIDLDKL
ncbi:MAG: ribonuclease Z [Paramuribaculum sp.]|nr:ribonuclease Z [Paramuribaculum sp.]